MHNSILRLPGESQTDVLGSLAKEFEQDLADLSRNAESELCGRRFVFSRYGRELYPYFEETGAGPAPGCIIPVKEGRPVASVDSTCVLLGETSLGALYAARAAVGLSCEGALRRFFRLGPILVYVSASGASGLGTRLHPEELSLALSDHGMAERIIRNTVELRVVGALMGSEEEIIVMSDGSLRHPMSLLSARLPKPACEGTRLVGFSKSSSLILSEESVGMLSRCSMPSCYTVEDGPTRTVLAKFAPDGLVFRLDVSPGEEALEAILGLLLWNDAFSSGYPDSLKVAHHLSIFSHADGQALRALVSKRFRLRHLPTFPLRAVALGSFKGGA